MGVKERYKKARADYERLVEIHDNEDVEDFTAGFLFEEKAMDLLRDPKVSIACEIYEELIAYASISGFGGRRAGAIKRTDEVIGIFDSYFLKINECLEDW